MDTLKIIVHTLNKIYGKLCFSGTTCDLTQSAIQELILKNLAFSGLIGQTIQIALIHDTLFVCSCHIFLLYTVVAYIYNYILSMLITLINLFNGKKFNVMRSRVDSNNFTIQEFYLGIIIVALILFLLPTIAMFYFVAFIRLMLSVLVMQICLLIL